MVDSYLGEDFEFPFSGSRTFLRKPDAPFRTLPSRLIRRSRSRPLASTKLTACKSTLTVVPVVMFVRADQALCSTSTQGPLRLPSSFKEMESVSFCVVILSTRLTNARRAPVLLPGRPHALTVGKTT